MIESVRFRWEFEILRQSGRFRRSGPIGLRQAQDPACDHPRVAFAISTSVGNAVARNKLRRRLKEVLRTMDDHHELTPGRYLVVPTMDATSATFGDLEHHLRRLLETRQ